jgi:hypothetical protein
LVFALRGYYSSGGFSFKLYLNVENRLNMYNLKIRFNYTLFENFSSQLILKSIPLMLLAVIFSSCISFNNSGDGENDKPINQKPPIPNIEISIQNKIETGMKSIKGHTFSLQNTILFSLEGTYPKDKLLNTQIVILNEDQNILTSLPASLATKPITLNVKGNKKLYIREIFNNSSTITRLSVNKDSLNYGLKL